VSRLAELERAVRERRDFSGFDTAYLHRAWRENALQRVRGRDRIRDGALAQTADEAAGPITVEAELDDDRRAMIAFMASGWRGHRWAFHEGSCIVGDVEILDGAARARALAREPEEEARRLGTTLPVHGPLGELRSGRGQIGETEDPLLPPGFPAGAAGAARYLHRVWNRRDLSAVASEWRGPAEANGDGAAFVLGILAALPDAVLLIEAGLVSGDRAAVLWRLHGHHLGQGWGTPSGQRERAIGSSVLTLSRGEVAAEDMLIDTLAMRAAAFRPVIDYAA
jgi:hypothetical protein